MPHLPKTLSSSVSHRITDPTGWPHLQLRPAARNPDSKGVALGDNPKSAAPLLRKHHIFDSKGVAYARPVSIPKMWHQEVYARKCVISEQQLTARQVRLLVNSLVTIQLSSLLSCSAGRSTSRLSLALQLTIQLIQLCSLCHSAVSCSRVTQLLIHYAM